MHYVDEGSGAPVLLLHGEPTWAFLYRKMIPRLAGVARVVAPDYFGFGRSDKPTRIEDYSYDFHYGSIERLADELDLRDATVVVQDWGGPIGLRLAVEHPERVSRLVILNTGIGAGRAPSPRVAALSRVRAACRPRSDPGTARPHLARDRPRRRRGRGVQRAVPDARVEGRRSRVPRARPDRDRPSERARRCSKSGPRSNAGRRPALVLFSDSDPIFSTVAAEHMASRIPGAGPAETVVGASHFLQEEKGEEIAERIVRFLAEA